MTEKELISKLQELKQIKPRRDWVVLSKINILGSDIPANKEVLQPNYKLNFSRISGLFFQKKFAYAFAVLLFIFVGIAGVIEYGLPDYNGLKIASQESVADISAQNILKNNVKEFKLKSQNLADAIKDKSQKPKNVSLALKEVNNAAKNLTDIIQKDTKLAETILDVIEIDDLKKTSDNLSEIIKNTDNQIIKDLEKTTLTENQTEKLDKAKDFMNQSKYTDALEVLLLLSE